MSLLVPEDEEEIARLLRWREKPTHSPKRERKHGPCNILQVIEYSCSTGRDGEMWS